MEQSLSSLAFEGSIPEAISEAKIQKKLFVVYISGDEDADSVRMESSTWADLKVSESISKYCILLHISEGSADAANFSKIYPQNSFPCITAVGYNGIKIWQHEGYIDAENLASSLEKAWLSLHIQETTASVMAAALARRTSESSISQAFPVATKEMGSSSTAVTPPSNGNVRSPETTSTPVVEEERHGGISVKEEGGTSAEPENEPSSALLDETHDAGHDNQCSTMGNECPSSEAKEKHLLELTEGSNSIPGSLNRNLSTEKLGPAAEISEKDVSQNHPSSNHSSDVHLNIRMLDGTSQQVIFPVTSTLRAVKDYVDEHQASDNGPYDLAIPYPRKVFDDQDLRKSLGQLELLGRQALIAVPRKRGGVSISRGRIDSSPADVPATNSEGYFAYARRMLSYLNPFSYLGGSGNAGTSSSGQDLDAGTREHRLNPNLRDDYAAPERRNSQGSTSQITTRSGKPTTSGFGSNIHTLKHDDDETRFTDRNSFWNGNSTQYGGDDNNDSR